MNFHPRMWCLPLAAASLMLPTIATATNGSFAQGFGVRSESLAGAGVAWTQDSFAVTLNPAGLVDIPDRFDVDGVLFRPKRGATLTQGGASADFSGNGRSNFLLPSLGVVHQLNDRIALGAALYGIGGLNTDYTSSPFARFGATGAAGVDIEQVFLSPAVGVRIDARQSVGLAVNFAYQRFKAKGLGVFAPFSSDPANLSDRGRDDGTGIGLRLGYQVKVTDQLSLGATWQSRTKTGRFKKYAGLLADGGDFDIPATYGVGAALHVTDAWTVLLDWQRIDFAKIHSLGNSSTAVFAGTPLGADDGPGFGWHNVSVVKLGTQYEVSPQLTLRAGFSKNHQPVRSGETLFNILAPVVVDTHLAVGGGWKVGASGEVEFSYLHAFRKTVHGINSIPPAFGGGEADVHLAEDAIGLGYSYRF